MIRHGIFSAALELPPGPPGRNRGVFEPVLVEELEWLVTGALDGTAQIVTRPALEPILDVITDIDGSAQIVR